MNSHPIWESLDAEVDRELYERDIMIRELKDILGVFINRMKEYHDKGSREEEFHIGDWVYLKLRPYRQQSI